MNREKRRGLCQALRRREYGKPATQDKNYLLSLGEDITATSCYKNKKCDIPGNPRATFLIRFSPNRCRIASTHGDHTVRVFDCRSGKCTHTLTGHPRTPWTVQFHPSNNNLLASGCLGGQVRIWDLNGGGSEVFNPPDKAVIASLAFHPTDKVLLFATGRKLYLWNWDRPVPFACIETASPEEKVRLVRFSPLGDKILTGVANTALRLMTNAVAALQNDPTSMNQLLQSVSCSRLDTNQIAEYLMRPASGNSSSVGVHMQSRAAQPVTHASSSDATFNVPSRELSTNTTSHFSGVMQDNRSYDMSTQRHFSQFQDHIGLGNTDLPSSSSSSLPPSLPSSSPSFSSTVSSTSSSSSSSLPSSLPSSSPSFPSTVSSTSSSSLPLSLSSSPSFSSTVSTSSSSSSSLPSSLPLSSFSSTVSTSSSSSSFLSPTSSSPASSLASSSSTFNETVSSCSCFSKPSSSLSSINATGVSHNQQTNFQQISENSALTNSTQSSSVISSNPGRSSSDRSEIHCRSHSCGTVSQHRQRADLQSHDSSVTISGEQTATNHSQLQERSSTTNQASLESHSRDLTRNRRTFSGTRFASANQQTSSGGGNNRNQPDTTGIFAVFRAREGSSWNLDTQEVDTEAEFSSTAADSQGHQVSDSMSFGRIQPNSDTESMTSASTDFGNVLLRTRSFTSELRPNLTSTHETVTITNQDSGNEGNRMSNTSEVEPQNEAVRIEAVDESVTGMGSVFNLGGDRLSTRTNPQSDTNPATNTTTVATDSSGATIATATARTFRHVHTAVVVADGSNGGPQLALRMAINRAIAGAFAGSGEGAVASNIINTTHRLQWWDFSKLKLPDLKNTEENVVCPSCKIHNDASVDVASDASMLAAFVPSSYGFPDDGVLAVFSLNRKNFAQCIFRKTFGPNAISVSLSPLNRYVMVGLAARRLHWHLTSRQLIAHIFKLETNNTDQTPDTMKPVHCVMHDCEPERRSHLSVNAAFFHPVVGCGLVYGTNRGHLCVCEVGPRIEEKFASIRRGSYS